MEFKFFNLEKDQGILKISFKNNEKYNAMRMDFFEELPDVVKYAEEDKEVVVVVFLFHWKTLLCWTGCI